MGTFDPGLFFGLLAIALGVFFGLRQLQKDVRGELTSIKERVIIIQERVSNVWDVIKASSLFGAGGTVTRTLKNMGQVTIRAEPHSDTTDYFIEAKRSIMLDGKSVVKLSKTTGLQAYEDKIFGERKVVIGGLLPHQIKLEVPCNDPKICTEYIRYFLVWLDEEYYKTIPKIEDFEEAI